MLALFFYVKEGRARGFLARPILHARLFLLWDDDPLFKVVVFGTAVVAGVRIAGQDDLQVSQPELVTLPQGNRVG